ncbi:4'-phosphopantetheinyl transferase family protein [Arthrobacter woluwensis]|uniref:4'-phosphopantetheinyl transferase family protein n=1 Tax=Arthrobacter woluwensis TaxID=156980 RepID=UPI001AAEAD9B|nr:4'-phosphopantetheinyl transferase superfamily protein [Arthrobacter woluwensis]QTF71074.1 4'-phosphopantetheinyl transferase superfamily protein [Arthrobacter woluwensis]
MRVITWLGSLDDAARDVGLPPLDDAERDRARAFTSAAAGVRFGTLRRIQRKLLADALGIDPRRFVSAYECPDCGPAAGHGRPGYVVVDRVPASSQHGDHTAAPGSAWPQRLTDVALSASRAGEWGAVVVVTGVEPGFRIGLDLTLHREIFDGFDDVALNGWERDWLRTQEPEGRNAERAALWAAKEAVAKRDGHGLRKDPAGILVLAAPGNGDNGTSPGGATAYAPGVVQLATRAEGLPPHVLTAAVPAAAEGAFRTAMA